MIRENIFENRFRLVEDLVRMGASIEVKGREARIHGGNPLRGCRVKARELRGGAALIVAALAAEGETQVCGCSFIHRGYEHICEDLFRLGGGAALIVAALAAEGETQVCGCSFIHRGYEHICEDLFRLGGQIKEYTGI